MSAFFAHLAGIALGRTEAGAARLSVPPRFAQIEAGGAGFEAEESDEAPGTQAHAPGRTPASGAPARAPAPDAVPVQSAAVPEAPESSPESVEPAGRISAGERRPRLPPRRAAERETVTVVAATTRSPAAPPARELVRPGIGDPSSPPAQAVTEPGEIRLPDAEAAAAPAASPQRPARTPAAPERAAAPGRPSAPLSDQALAGRSERLPKVDPVIHVTIDRIEVRAPAGPKPPPAPRRPPAEPSVSLAEFLRRGGSGARQ